MIIAVLTSLLLITANAKTYNITSTNSYLMPMIAQHKESTPGLANYKLSGDKRVLYGFNKPTAASSTSEQSSQFKLPSIVSIDDDEMTHHF